MEKKHKLRIPRRRRRKKRPVRVETLWPGVLVPTCSSSAEDRGGEGRWSFGNPPGSPIHSAFSLQLRGHLIRSSARLCEREADSCLQQRFQQRRERESQPGDQPTDRRTASGVWIFTHDGSFSCFPPPHTAASISFISPRRGCTRCERRIVRKGWKRDR